MGNFGTHTIVDLLPDHEAATLAQGLTGHPGVEVIARDRAGTYALGARGETLDATQVANRWHLLRNCSKALLNVLERGHPVFRQVGKSLASQVRFPRARQHAFGPSANITTEPSSNGS